MRPHLAFRLCAVFVPFGIALVVLSLAEQDWFPAVCLALGTGAMVNTLVALRRRGVSWHGPRTFREMRELDRRRADD
jgi:hypothetical protein